MRRRHSIISITGLLLAAIIAFAAPSFAATKTFVRFKLTTPQVAAVHESVRDNLKDPESARFGQMFAAKPKEGGMPMVCGYVNAKNSYGGYVGEQPFIGVLVGNGNFATISIGDGGAKSVVAFKMCRENGVGI
jgi:hypothetical protein